MITQGKPTKTLNIQYPKQIPYKPKCLPKSKVDNIIKPPITIDCTKNGSFLWHLKYVATENTNWFV